MPFVALRSSFKKVMFIASRQVIVERNLAIFTDLLLSARDSKFDVFIEFGSECLL